MRKLTRTLFILACATELTATLFCAAQLKTRERYVLRPGDTLETEYRLTPDLNQTVVIEPDGFVNLHVAGDVHVGGLTVEQARDLIVKQATVRLNEPELNLVLKDFTRPMVTVAGEVSKPGRLELKENTSALGAIMQSGGFTKDAKSGQVILFRKVNDSMAEVKQLNLSNMKKTSDLERDIDLRPGDMIYVPRDKIAVIQRYVSLINLGTYFPVPY